MQKGKDKLPGIRVSAGRLIHRIEPRTYKTNELPVFHNRKKTRNDRRRRGQRSQGKTVYRGNRKKQNAFSIPRVDPAKNQYHHAVIENVPAQNYRIHPGVPPRGEKQCPVSQNSQKSGKPQRFLAAEKTGQGQGKQKQHTQSAHAYQ